MSNLVRIISSASEFDRLTKNVHVTIDMDVLGPPEAPGMGTPETQ